MKKNTLAKQWAAWPCLSDGEPVPCPTWPRCACVVRGFVNIREPNNCGRAPLMNNEPHMPLTEKQEVERGHD